MLGRRPGGIFWPSVDSEVVVMKVGANTGSQVLDLLGRSPRVRGEVVCGRLDTFVAPIVEVGPEDVSDLDWIRHHNAKVRESVRGSTNLTQRLSGESEEAEQERLPERVVKGEAFTVKMLEQRLRQRDQT